MSTKVRWTEVCLVAIIISGCALQHRFPFRPVTDPMTRIQGEGFSVLPPQGKEWYIESQGPYKAMFIKLVPGKYTSKPDAYHTFLAGAGAVPPEAVVKASAASEFPKALEEKIMA